MTYNEKNFKKAAGGIGCGASGPPASLSRSLYSGHWDKKKHIELKNLQVIIYKVKNYNKYLISNTRMT